MLEKILKLYTMAMAYDVRSPLPHLFGPPGCGKSTVAQQAADLIGCNLHIINVARISPLEIEGVQMPVDHVDGMKLSLLTATFWTQLKEGDILLLDEFLRGFPEVYNGLLDILTSREVGGFKLPKVFILAASNSTVAYDKALEDRLLHITVPDPRTNKTVKKEIAVRLVETLGLMPKMADSMEMQTLLDTEILPMYSILDKIKGKSAASAASIEGVSLRNLIGQAQLREVKSQALNEMLHFNNLEAMRQGKPQFVLLPSGQQKDRPPNYDTAAAKLVAVKDTLSPLERVNLDLNLQLVELESIRSTDTKETTSDDDDIFAAF